MDKGSTWNVRRIMNQITLLKLKKFVAPYVSGGVSFTDQRVIDRINEIEERLLNKNIWKNATATVSMCIVNGYITLSRDIETILKARVNGRFSHVWSQWYEFLSNGPGLLDDKSYRFMDLVDRGFTPTQYDIPIASNAYLMCLSEFEDDDGATITIQGTDDEGKEITTNGVPGETLVLCKNTPVYSKNLFSSITSIQKDETSGYTYLCTWEPSTSVRYHLSAYHPLETNPIYRRFAIGEMFTKQTDLKLQQEACTQRLDCIVKRQHVDLMHDNDIPVIQNTSAFKVMSLAINFENDSEVEKAMQLEAKAEKILEEQLKSTQTKEPELDFEIREGVGIGTIHNV